MRSRLCTALALLTAALTTTVRAQENRLTLDEAMQAVEKANLNVLLGREAVAQSVGAAQQVRVNVLPNVAATAQQRRTQTVNIVSGNAVDGTLANRFDGKLTGNYLALNPQQLSAYRSAKVGVDVSEADLKSTIQLSQATVAQTYFTHLRNLRRIDVLDANVNRARDLLKLAQTFFDAGSNTQIDVTRAEAQLAQAQFARLQQDTVVLQSALQLERLLDLDPTKALKLEVFNVRRGPAGEVGAILGNNLFAQRADWIRANLAVDQSKLDVRTAKFERLPNLSLGGEYGKAAANFDDDGQRNAWFLGVTLSVPVFDGLKSGADKRVALSKQRSQEFRLHNLEQQITAEVRLAVQDANSRDSQISVAQKSLELAEQQFRLAQKRFHEGVADNREVIEAQNALAVASDGMVDAVYQYQLSRLELARAKGEVRDILKEKE